MNGLKGQGMLISMSFLIISTFTSMILYFMGHTQYLMSIVLIAMGFLFYIMFYYKNNRDTLNIDGVFSWMWLVSLGLSNLRLSSMQYEWDFITWIVLVLSWLLYLMGSKIPELVVVKKNNGIEYKSYIKKKMIFDYKKLRRNIIILFFISFASFTLEVLRAGFIPILSADMSAYVNFNLPFFHYNTVAMSVVVILTFTYLINNNNDRIMKVLLIIGLLQIVSLMSRQLLIFTLVGCFIVYHFTKQRISVKNIAISFFIVIIMFSLFGELRNQSLEYLYHVAHIRPDVGESYLMWPYLYFTMGFENMRSLLNASIEYSFGRFTFAPLWEFSRVRTLFQPGSNISYFTIKEFNVSTYLATFYLDFGLIGVFLGPFFIGVLSKIIYIKSKIKKIKVNIYLFLYIFVLHHLSFSFFVNFYADTSLMVNLGYLILLYYSSFSIDRTHTLQN